MSLEAITGGEGLEMIIFWSIGAFTLTVGAIDSLYKWWKYERTYESD